jgi:hypothetical protein
MDKEEFRALSAVIDGRLEAIGIEGATHMVRMFEMLSASFANEDERPSVMIHGAGKKMVVLSVNVEMVDMLEMLATAYTSMHEMFIGDKPEQGELH